MGTISAEGTGGIGDKLDGKVAVITGDSGIGRAAAQRLVADGAYVFIAGRRQRALELDARAQWMMLPERNTGRVHSYVRVPARLGNRAQTLHAVA